MSSELQIGEAFAGHRIDAVAGRGGMGVVYRATQLDLDRTVALKLITPALAEDPVFRERFIRETRVAAGIDHPNVIPVFYAGEHEGRLYLAMRYVVGEDLRTLIRREGALEPDRAARIVAQIASALDAAHASGIVHRDVKPANVLLGAGDHAYLTDFGLTKRVHSASGMTKVGGWVGTLGFVAPEQIRGERVDARTDVYALGCVLQHALTGEPPHRRESDEATMWAHLHEVPAPLGAGVPPALSDVVVRSLAKDPGDRFPSAGDLGRAVLAAVGAAGPAAVPERMVATGAAAPAGLLPPVDADTIGSPSTTAPVTGATSVSAAATRLAPPPVAGASGRRRHRPQTAFLVIVLLSVALVAGLVALLLSAGDGTLPAARTSTDRKLPSALAFTPARLTGTVRAGSSPNDVVATARVTWVSSAVNARLTRISTPDRKALGTVDVGVGVQSLAVGFDTLWVAKQKTQSLLRLDPVTGSTKGQRFVLPDGLPVVVATGQGGVWVALRRPGRIVRLNPQTGAVTFSLDLPAGVQDMTVGEGAVWVVSRTRQLVTRVDPVTKATLDIPVGAEPRGIAVGDGYVWVCNSADATVTRIDPRRGRVRGTFRTGDTPTGIDIGGGSVWIANNVDGTVTRLSSADPPRRLQTIGGLTNPFAVAARGPDVWVTDPAASVVAHLSH